MTTRKVEKPNRKINLRRKGEISEEQGWGGEKNWGGMATRCYGDRDLKG